MHKIFGDFLDKDRSPNADQKTKPGAWIKKRRNREAEKKSKSSRLQHA